jgi:hypothetical protein
MSNHQARGSIPPARDAAPVWDIAVPSRPGRMAGVRMAGFTNRAKDLVDLQVVPCPAVTLFIDLGDGVLVDHASGQQQRGGLAVGLAPSGVRGRGRDIECLQVRLSPVVAHAVLGASSELGGTVVALDDLWGRDAVRAQELRGSQRRPGSGRKRLRRPVPPPPGRRGLRRGNARGRCSRALARGRPRRVGRPAARIQDVTPASETAGANTRGADHESGTFLQDTRRCACDARSHVRHGSMTCSAPRCPSSSAHQR